MHPTWRMDSAASAPRAPPGPTLEEIYVEHGDFVWRTLARFGVSEPDRPDELHEVFVVAHRRLPEFRGDASITTWLFGIARRVASSYRRRGHRTREVPCERPYDGHVAPDQLEDEVARRQARARLERILQGMTLDQRAVFVMFEIDGLKGQEIADMMGCPVQTIFSRLRRARAAFERDVGQLHAAPERTGVDP